MIRKVPGYRDRNPHKRRDDAGVTRYRRPVEQPGVRRFRAERKRGERVHDDIDPEDLNDGKRLRVTEERCDEHKDTGTEVNRELEDKEALDILVQRPAPPDCACYRCKGVVEKDDVACLPCHFGTGNTHRKPHVRVP